jgi:UDP:flavonoid glycosyltransferase YjiC (YdhE family)
MPQSIKVERYGNGLSLNSLDKQINLLDKTFEEITSNTKYQEKANKLQKKFESFGGSVRAADLICDLID